MNAADAPRLLDRLGGPDAGVAVPAVSPRAEEILGHEREVLRRARGHEQHGEVVTDAADRAYVGFRAIEHAAEFLAAMAVLEDADARLVEIPDRGLRAPEHAAPSSIAGPDEKPSLPRCAMRAV